jgi:hypothetical protein
MNPMNSDRIFEAAIRASKNLLWQNLQSTNDLPDAATVIRLRELVHSPSIRSALLHSSDTLLAFALRAVEHVVADQSQTDREIITRLWDVLEDPHLNQALGMTQNSRFMIQKQVRDTALQALHPKKLRKFRGSKLRKKAALLADRGKHICLR